MLAPLVVAALIAFAQTGRDLFPWGDHAIVEGETMRAWAGDQLLGTYSRYGWHHPGPALFYWMAPWHALFGDSPAALNGAVALLNALAVGAIVAVVARRAGRSAAFGAAAVIGLYIAQQGPTLVRDFWIPHSVVLPFGALIVLTAGAAAGSLWLVPLVALVASFLAETDLSLAPASLAVLAAGLGFFVARRGWREIEWNRRVAAIVAVSVLVAAVVWYPPIHEELRAGPGNVDALRQFFGQPNPGHSLREGGSAVANSAGVLLGGHRAELYATPSSFWAKAFLLVTLALLALGSVIGWRRGRPFASALCVTALAALAGEIYAVTQVRGELFTYLVDWVGVAAAVGWIGIGCALAPARRSAVAPAAAPPSHPPRVRAGTATAVLATLAFGIAVWNIAGQARKADLAKNDGAYVNQAQKPIDLAVRNWMRANRKSKPVIYIPQNDPWPLAAGVYIDRLRHDQNVAIEPGWLGVFGSNLAPDNAVDSELVFTDAAQPPPTPGSKRIAEAGGVAVYAGPPRP